MIRSSLFLVFLNAFFFYELFSFWIETFSDFVCEFTFNKSIIGTDTRDHAHAHVISAVKKQKQFANFLSVRKNHFANFWGNEYKSNLNKKVLLRERKRHTARHAAVASACYSGGVPRPRSGGVPHPRSGGGYPVPGLGGTLSQVQQGYPIPGLGGYPIPGPGGVPHPMEYPSPPRCGLRN